ncbi:MAG: hypothetical protein AcusKO_08690 [Acuticoccus sp.]
MSGSSIIFSCEGADHEIALTAEPGSETLRQLFAWLPAETTIHCAKIAGCHIYWPSPILARLEGGTDIHTLPPGSFLYYPDRQYLELIYDTLQAEKASVTHLGRLVGEIGWLREYAERQRREAGGTVFSATLRLAGDAPAAAPAPADEAAGGDACWTRLCRRRQAVWQAEPDEIGRMLDNRGHNIPFGPLMTADGYFRFAQESLWQLWNAPARFSDDGRRAAAINAMELAIARVGHFCHLADSEAFFADAIEIVEAGTVPLDDLLCEVILYASKMSNWVDSHVPWYAANEITRAALGRPD